MRLYSGSSTDFIHDSVHNRIADKLHDAYLEIERERLELEKEKAEKWTDDKLEELLKQPQTKQRLCGEGLSAEERARRMREIFGLPPEEKRRRGLSAEALAEIERAAKLL